MFLLISRSAAVALREINCLVDNSTDVSPKEKTEASYRYAYQDALATYCANYVVNNK